MAQTMHIFLIIISFTVINFAFAIDNQDLHAWHAKIRDKKFSCPAPKESLLDLNTTGTLFQVVDCDDPSAIFRYDFKVSLHNRQNMF